MATAGTQRQLNVGIVSLPLSEFDKVVTLSIDQQAGAGFTARNTSATAGSNILTTTYTYDMYVGQVLSHTAFSATGFLVVASIIDGGTFTATSNAATTTVGSMTPTVQRAMNFTSGSNIVSFMCGDTSDMNVGQVIVTPANGNFIVASIIDSTSFTMTTNAPVTGIVTSSTLVEYEYVMFSRIEGKSGAYNGPYKVPTGKTLFISYVPSNVVGVVGMATSPTVEYAPSKRLKTFKKPVGWTTFGLNNANLKSVPCGVTGFGTSATGYIYMFPSDSYPCLKLTTATPSVATSGTIVGVEL